MSGKENKARELAGSLCSRANLSMVIVGSWDEMELYQWLAFMGYEWDGESWQKSS